MADRRYESAMFWLAFGTAAAVIGLALMTIAVTRSTSGENLLTSVWFDGGLALLIVGALLLLLALGLYMNRRRANPEGGADAPAAAQSPERKWNEAIRGYYSERDRLFKMWDRQQRSRRRKS